MKDPRLTFKGIVIVLISSALSLAITAGLMGEVQWLSLSSTTLIREDIRDDLHLQLVMAGVKGGAVGGLILGGIWILLIVAGRATSGIGATALVGAIVGLLLGMILVVTITMLTETESKKYANLLTKTGSILAMGMFGAGYGGLLACFTRILGRLVGLRAPAVETGGIHA